MFNEEKLTLFLQTQDSLQLVSRTEIEEIFFFFFLDVLLEETIITNITFDFYIFLKKTEPFYIFIYICFFALDTCFNLPSFSFFSFQKKLFPLNVFFDCLIDFFFFFNYIEYDLSFVNLFTDFYYLYRYPDIFKVFLFFFFNTRAFFSIFIFFFLFKKEKNFFFLKKFFLSFKAYTKPLFIITDYHLVVVDDINITTTENFSIFFFDQVFIFDEDYSNFYF